MPEENVNSPTTLREEVQQLHQTCAAQWERIERLEARTDGQGKRLNEMERQVYGPPKPQGIEAPVGIEAATAELRSFRY